jgi:hypothetical protein
MISQCQPCRRLVYLAAGASISTCESTEVGTKHKDVGGDSSSISRIIDPLGGMCMSRLINEKSLVDCNTVMLVVRSHD